MAAVGSLTACPAASCKAGLIMFPITQVSELSLVGMESLIPGSSSHDPDVISGETEVQRFRTLQKVAQ